MRIQTPDRPLTPPSNSSKCNPTNPGPDKVFMSTSVTGTTGQIIITVTYQACSQSYSRTYRVIVEDDETFIFPDDLSPATLQMLNGISLAFSRLARYGFDREPRTTQQYVR